MKNMKPLEWEKHLNKMSTDETAFENFMKLRQPSDPSCLSGADAQQCKNWMLCTYGYGTYSEFLHCAYRGYESYRLMVANNRETKFQL